MGVLGDGLLPILEQSADVCLPDNSFGEEGVHRSIGQKQKHRIVRLAFIGPTSQDANSGTVPIACVLKPLLDGPVFTVSVTCILPVLAFWCDLLQQNVSKKIIELMPNQLATFLAILS